MGIQEDVIVSHTRGDADMWAFRQKGGSRRIEKTRRAITSSVDHRDGRDKGHRSRMNVLAP